MNTLLRDSKKFRAAILVILTNIITILVGKLGLDLDTETITLLACVISIPIMTYIGAEGVSEIHAKSEIEKNKSRKEINEEIVQQILQGKDPNEKIN